ncbi:hypothetical protein INT43_006428 [Umbelopsis isabellina]|uniref:Uncharacterized protein n=1 Tax=Mortierella isabellina TaxID=91625 RepID=A0A8H7Q000_MORIS|nr:hypothetical protein INT43_006428 [Umbelopsis isabellina]
MFTVGLAMVYLASLLQDPPFERPKALHIADRAFFERKPDDIVLSVAGPYLYMSAVWREGEYPEKYGHKRGTGREAIGVRGRIKQFRAPLELFRSNSRVVEEEAHWEELFVHDVNGKIAHISKHPDQLSPPNVPGKSYFSVLYQEIDGEHMKHVARVYYLGKSSNKSSIIPGIGYTETIEYRAFDYKDLVLPGTTWISAFSLEDGMLLYTRDPDRYYFRTVPLPADMYRIKVSDEDKRLVVDASTEGYVMRGRTQPKAFTGYDDMVARLYSPVNDTLRLATLRVFKFTDYSELTLTVMDNLTELDTSQQLEPGNNWRTRGFYDPWTDKREEDDYSPINENHYYQPERIFEMPKLATARSASLKTFLFPYRNAIFSMDYVDDEEQLRELGSYETIIEEWFPSTKGDRIGGAYMFFDRETIIVPYVDGNYEQEFHGVILNEDGNICVAWTNKNYIFIYKRGEAYPDRLSLQTVEGEDTDMNDLTEEEAKRHTSKLQRLNLIRKASDLMWSPPWAITSFPGHSRNVGIVAAEVWNSTRSFDRSPSNILLLAMKDGRVHSYALEHSEEQTPTGIWSFVTKRWDMLTVMLGAIVIFVINEIRNHPPF